MSELVAPKVPTAAPVWENALAGFHLVAQVNQKRQELALAVQKAQQDLVKQQMDAQLKSRELDISAQHYDHLYDIEKKQQDRIAKREQFVAGQTKEQAEATTAMMGEVTSITDPRDSQAWRDKTYDILLKYPNAARSPEYNLLKQQATKSPSNPAVKTQQSTLDAAISRSGVDKKAVYRALNNPDAYTSPIPGNPDQIGIYVGEKPLPKDVVAAGGMVTNTDINVKGDSDKSKLFGKSYRNTQTQVAPTKLYVPFKKSTWDGFQTTFRSVNGEPDGTARVMPQPAPDTPQPKTLDAPTAKMFLQQSGGDKDKARKLAIDSGYTF